MPILKKYINLEKEKQLTAKEAVKLINNNLIVGLGTGSSAVYAIKEIGEIVQNELKVLGVPNSNKTKLLAQ